MPSRFPLGLKNLSRLAALFFMKQEILDAKQYWLSYDLTELRRIPAEIKFFFELPVKDRKDITEIISLLELKKLEFLESIRKLSEWILKQKPNKSRRK